MIMANLRTYLDARLMRVVSQGRLSFDEAARRRSSGSTTPTRRA